ncbi:hypothetical protein ACWEPC_00405 [Nonomuraea sp. NPDC004297]
MSWYREVVGRRITTEPLHIEWFATDLEVRVDSTPVRDHIADQFYSTMPLWRHSKFGSSATLDAVADPELLTALSAEVFGGPVQWRESFRDVWYALRRLSGGEYCLLVDNCHDYPHALLTRDFRSWAFVGDRQETLSIEVTRTIREIVREDVLALGGLMFHGAAAELPDGRGIFLGGASGAGKTSAAIRLAQCGGRVIGTDRTFLLHEGDGWLAVGLPSTTRLDGSAIDAFGIRSRVAGRTPWRDGKYCLSNKLVDDVLGFSFTAVTRADVIIVLDRKPGAAARVRALTGKEAGSALGEHLLTPDPLYRSHWLSADPEPKLVQRDRARLDVLVASRTTTVVTWEPRIHCNEGAAQLLCTKWGVVP